MAELYFVHEKTGKKYKVVKYDKEAGMIRLKGETGEFDEKYDQQRFAKMGYKPVQS